MCKNGKGAVIGGSVIINSSDYDHFTVGKSYEVIEVGESWVGLLNDLGQGDSDEDPYSGWCFSNSEFDI